MKLTIRYADGHATTNYGLQEELLRQLQWEMNTDKYFTDIKEIHMEG